MVEKIPPHKIHTIAQPPQPPAGERMIRAAGCIVEFIQWTEAMDAENLKKNSTKAAKIAKDLAEKSNMVVTVKNPDGITSKESVISGEVFNNYVKENFPNIEFKPVQNYITIQDARDSITTYYVKQQAYEMSQKKAELQEQSGQDSAPDMGV